MKESEESEANTTIDLVNEQLERMDFSEIEEFWLQIVEEYGGFLPELKRQSVIDYMKRVDEFTFKDVVLGTINFIFHELIINGKLIGTLILLTILSMFLQTLQNSFEKQMYQKLLTRSYLWC